MNPLENYFNFHGSRWIKASNFMNTVKEIQFAITK